jgi:hypothetical protein
MTPFAGHTAYVDAILVQRPDLAPARIHALACGPLRNLSILLGQVGTAPEPHRAAVVQSAEVYLDALRLAYLSAHAAVSQVRAELGLPDLDLETVAPSVPVRKPPR